MNLVEEEEVSLVDHFKELLLRISLNKFFAAYNEVDFNRELGGKLLEFASVSIQKEIRCCTQHEVFELSMLIKQINKCQLCAALTSAWLLGPYLPRIAIFEKIMSGISSSELSI